MDSNLISVLGVLGGVIVGGLINHIATKSAFKKQKEWQRDQVVRDKLEELADAVDQVSHGWREFCVNCVKSIAADTPLEQVRQIPPFSKVQILVSFYAPELKTQLNQILKARDDMKEPIPRVMVGLETDAGSKGEAVGGLMASWSRMDGACEELVAAAATQARSRLGLQEKADD